MGGRGSSSRVSKSGGGSITARIGKLSMEKNALAEESQKLFKEKMKAKRNGEEFTKQKQYDNIRKKYDKLDSEIKKLRAKIPQEKKLDNWKEKLNTTTTYDKAYARRKKNFDAWFNGGK